MGLTSSSISNAVTEITSFLTSAQADPSMLPSVISNPLHQFQSYNCLFTLACLS